MAKAGDFRHWTKPQTVPRGFLRLYLLFLLSRGPQTGYSIMLFIDERTDGAWKPGPGTVYPLLRSLAREKLVSRAGPKGAGGKVAYSLTVLGRKELAEVPKSLSSMGKKERVMIRLFTDLLPPATAATIMVSGARDASGILREVLMRVPRAERVPLIRELELVAESQLAWAKAQL